MLKLSALIFAFSASWRFNLHFPIGNLGSSSPITNIAVDLAEPSAEMTQISANFADQ